MQQRRALGHTVLLTPFNRGESGLTDRGFCMEPGGFTGCGLCFPYACWCNRFAVATRL